MIGLRRYLDLVREHGTLAGRAQELERQLLLLEGLLAEAAARSDALTKQLLELKRDGWTPPLPVGEPMPAAPLPEDVAKAIGERSEPGTWVERQLRLTAKLMLDSGVPAEMVAQRVLEGEEVDDL